MTPFFFKSRALAAALCIGMIANPIHAVADDIDIFVGSSAGSHDNPNVLIVLDNTSNWSRQSQQWPGGVQQGQSEVRAIQTVINSSAVGSDVNVGLFEFVTEGNASQDTGGKVRYAIQPMSSTNKAAISTTLTTIFNGVTDPLEKRNSGTRYGDLMNDVYSYFAGRNAYSTGGVSGSSRVDANGYTSPYGTFKSPLNKDNSCAKNYVIFVSNPDQSGPTKDSGSNLTTLGTLGGNTGQLALPNFSTGQTSTGTVIGNSTVCQATCSVPAAYAGASYAADCSDTTKYPNGCSCGSAVPDIPNCAAGTARYMVQGTLNAGSVVKSGTSSDCYPNAVPAGGTSIAPSGYPSHQETFACPSGSSVYFNSSTLITANGSCKSKYSYSLSCKSNSPSTTNLGYTSACYSTASSPTCQTTDYAAQCAGYSSCACSSSQPITTGSSCAAGTSLYAILGNSFVTTVTPTGTSTLDTATYNIDEWARFLYQQGVPVAGGSNQTVSTYTIDVFNAQQNATHTSLMMSTANAGGGKYFTATNEAALVNAFKQIFAEIVSVNSTFASASLPVNATNRAQNENQVFIGMFRPDPQAKPRWFGNLKRYQLILASDGQTVLLGDKYNQAAVNDQTGFISDCATSYWTSDSGTYWQNYPVNPSPVGACGTTTFSPYSDAPDGPRVEKGAVAEVLRKGNGPTATDSSPSWAVNRTQYTTPSASSTALQLLSASSLATLSSTTQSWTLGHDTENENSGALNIDNTGTLNTNQTTALTETRATIHGDVVHSRPLPINYGGSIVVYYGANDGNFRAVDAETGKEIWSFIPFEFTSRMERLRTNSPLVNYPNVDMTITPTPTRKDYFWDGSIGVLQNADNSKVWIYPTMRRGGRSVYALDVTNSTAPTIKWKAGCPNLTDDSGCTGGMSGIGQTWAVPNVAPVKGYGGGMTPVVLLGGGYDTCEDANTASPACSSPKGAAVYILDADSGSLVSTLPTARSVAADVAVIDVDGDGNADYAYVLDTGGNVYRINFVSRTVAVDGTVSYTPLASAAWTITKVAHTSGAGRKFLFSPALFPTSPKIGKVYLAMGTGDREHPLASQYPFGAVTNRFYVYLDDLSAAADNNLDDASAMSDFTTDPGCGAGEIVPTSSKKGWYMDLTQYGVGEQTVTSPLIVSGLITFSTNRPIPPTQGSCSTPLGEARGYWVSLLNGSGAIQCSGTNCSCGGSRSTTFVGGGLPPSPVIGTVPVAGMPTTVVIGAPQRGGGASSPISPQKAKPLVAAKRKRVYTYIKGEN